MRIKQLTAVMISAAMILQSGAFVYADDQIVNIEENRPVEEQEMEINPLAAKEPDGEKNPQEGEEVDGEKDPEEGDEADGEKDPEEGGEADREKNPEKGGEADGEKDPEEGGETDGEKDPEEGGETDGEKDPEEGDKADGEKDPQEGDETDGEKDPEEGGEADEEKDPLDQDAADRDAKEKAEEEKIRELQKNCNHKWTSWRVIDLATVSKKGKLERNCTRCRKTDYYNLIKAKVVLRKRNLVLRVYQKKNAVIQLHSFGDQVVSWKTSNPWIARVDKNGVITGLRRGKARVTVLMKSGAKGVCKISVIGSSEKMKKAKKAKKKKKKK